MRLHPSFEYRPRHLGEDRVYRLLQDVEDPAGFAVHSVNLPDHEYKRWGEADFVVVSTAGVTVLEVKGGIVTYADRVWCYSNARGQAIRSTEGPARQAMSAARALEKLLSKAVGRGFHVRWGVVFPLSHVTKELPELPASHLATREVCDDPRAFLEFLRGIPDHPAGRVPTTLSPRQVEEVREILLSEFTATTSLGLAVEAVTAQTIRLTQQQSWILEALASEPRLIVAGGAGTGKTELAALCARADRAAGRRPVIITREGPFREALAGRLVPEAISVVSGPPPSGFDTMIVDEGQDFAFPDAMRALFASLPGGLEGGRWRWFMDPNLQFSERPPDADVLALLEAQAVKVHLTRNVRSTREIVDCIRTVLGADLGVSEIDGYGISVMFHNAPTVEVAAGMVTALVLKALEEGVLPEDIALLGPDGADGGVCRRASLLLEGVLRIRPRGRLVRGAGQGAVASIADLRGLEARVVILTDLERLPQGATSDALAYIGMSRASAALHIVSTGPGKTALLDIVKKHIDGENP